MADETNLNSENSLSSIIVRDKNTATEKKYMLQDSALTKRVKTLEDKEITISYIPNGEIEEICK